MKWRDDPEAVVMVILAATLFAFAFLGGVAIVVSAVMS